MTADASPASSSAQVGFVIIGRNEGDRLKRCIESVRGSGQIVYVDSGSSDGSADWAREHGVSVVDLDMSQPFTAARARNEGFARLQQIAPSMPFVQFVDGDCEVVGGWVRSALSFMQSHPHVAAACGRRRERLPEASIYNRLCDMEWNTPSGKARSCGGDVMMRSVALSAAAGYRADLIAGEEPELCVRLRAAGWEVWRLPPDMTLHDANITRFGQWWKRARRAGHAFAEGASIHGASPERRGVQQMGRALAWGIALPVFTLLLAVFAHPAWLLLLLAYPLQVLRLALRDDIGNPNHRLRALFYVLGRFPEAQGVVQFWANRAFKRRSALIEYK